MVSKISDWPISIAIHPAVAVVAALVAVAAASVEDVLTDTAVAALSAAELLYVALVAAT